MLCPNAHCLFLQSHHLMVVVILIFQVKMAVQYMRRVIQRKAKFDIMDLNVVQVHFLK
jgi:hypothetical protein